MVPVDCFRRRQGSGGAQAGWRVYVPRFRYRVSSGQAQSRLRSLDQHLGGRSSRLHSADGGGGQALGYKKECLHILLVQTVNLLRGGRRVTMSKRAGELITLREVVEEVGADAAKFIFLTRRSDTQLDFDLELAKQKSADNPVYYVQSVHARFASVFRVAAERGIQIPSTAEVDWTILTSADELNLIKALAEYPPMLEASAQALEPHRITYYLQELAARLHTYYYKHRILPPALDAEV